MLLIVNILKNTELVITEDHCIFAYNRMIAKADLYDAYMQLSICNTQQNATISMLRAYTILK